LRISKKLIAISIVCLVVLGLGILAMRTMVNSQRWIIVETGARTVCSDCGEILDEAIEAKRIRAKDAYKYKVKVEKVLCGRCELKRKRIKNGWEYLVKKKKIQQADRLEIYSVETCTSSPVKTLKATFHKGDGNFEQILGGIEHAKWSGPEVRMLADGLLVFYSDQEELVELGFNSVDYRIEIPIKKETDEKVIVFVSSSVGKFIASYLGES